MEIDAILKLKFDELVNLLTAMDRVVIAMSAGVDSVFLAKVASDVLGERALAVTADSPSLPRGELDEAQELAQRFGIHHHIIQSTELMDPRFRSNTSNRCYYCKDLLFEQLDVIAHQFQANWVCFGENVDDVSDLRPGSQAARKHAARAPLLEVGLGKAEIRQLARAVGLHNWDKPSSACLASRIPHGTEITPEKLSKVEAAEEFLHLSGFCQVRVRYHDEIARIEVEPGQMTKLLSMSGKIYDAFRQIGFTYTALDIIGYRIGSLNESLQLDIPVENLISQ